MREAYLRLCVQIFTVDQSHRPCSICTTQISYADSRLLTAKPTNTLLASTIWSHWYSMAHCLRLAKKLFSGRIFQGLRAQKLEAGYRTVLRTDLLGNVWDFTNTGLLNKQFPVQYLKATVSKTTTKSMNFHLQCLFHKCLEPILRKFHIHISKTIPIRRNKISWLALILNKYHLT